MAIALKPINVHFWLSLEEEEKEQTPDSSSLPSWRNISAHRLLLFHPWKGIRRMRLTIAIYAPLFRPIFRPN